MNIKSRARDYSVQFEPSFESAIGKVAKKDNVITLIDARVFELYQETVCRHITGTIIPIVATEENKSYNEIGKTIEKVLEAGARKGNHLAVIGGGVIQDIGGFIASVLFRGAEWTLVPTTLLAQCDSCIGSKTSVNIASFKNQLGTFCPPNEVLIARDVLQTLTPDDLRSGLCEALKLALIEGPEAVSTMKRNWDDIASVVKQSLAIKKVFIEEDEFDKARRNLLNYGHTFGHAFEAVSQFAVPHGVAVGIGMDAATYFSFALGYVDEEHYQTVRGLLSSLTSESVKIVKSLNLNDLVRAMKNDKKSSQNEIGFILTKGFGRMERVRLPYDQAAQLLGQWHATLA
jgi:3-dehydroquinate synthase